MTGHAGSNEAPRPWLARLQVPVVAAPMFWLPAPNWCWRPVAPASSVPFRTPNARPIEVLDDWMQRITTGLQQAAQAQGADTLGPWCANLVTHSSNTRLGDDLRLVARYQPPMVVTALGSPASQRCRPYTVMVGW